MKKNFDNLYEKLGGTYREETALYRKKRALGSCPKGQFCRNTVYLERGMPYFAFVDTNAVLVRKIDKS